MLHAINAAESSILFETFVYWTGEIADKFSDAFARKAKDGVSVKVLLDSHGSKAIRKELISQMKQAGVDVRWFRRMKLRFWDYDKRTHRKILVCDDRVGFTGGVGIAKEWEGDARNPSEWRETHFELRGSTVRGLTGAFWNNWIDVEGKTLPYKVDAEDVGDAEDAGNTTALVVRSSPATHQSDMELVFQSLLTVARHRITITTPYFNIRKSTSQLLIDKAKQGVSISIIIPGEHIDKSFELLVAEDCIAPLLEEGIKIYRYEKTMIHTKALRADDTLACVGSPNFNQRSRKKDFEIALVIADKEIASKLDEHFEEDLQHSRPLTLKTLRKMSIFRKLRRKFLMIFREQF